MRPDDTGPVPDPRRSRPPGPSPRRIPKGPAHGSSKRRGGRGLFLTAGLATGVLAALAAARRLGRDAPPLYRSLRSSPREWWWGGCRIVYYETGRAAENDDAEPVVLVHSIHAAASAWEMRELFARLGADRRVLAYDLLGFGASDRPDADYDPDLYRELLRDFLREVAGGPAHVVASSVSAAHALELAAREPALFRSLVAINPTGLLTQAESPGRGGRVLQNLFRLPWLGEALYNLLVSRPSLRWYGARLYRDPEVRDEATEQRWVAAHQPGARFAPAAFLGNALGENAYMALRTLEVPTLAIWSPSEIVDTVREQEAFGAVAPGIEQAWIEDSGSVPHEERPDEVERLLRDFWARLPT
jgi:pimeloyl-ACP methyl ester carboxylesterase